MCVLLILPGNRPTCVGTSQQFFSPKDPFSMTLRIISGEFRRRLLQTPQGQTTRPYTDRVRQMVFDRISELVPDAHVADVFSGVGTMGLEALSRGASSCVFFEGDPKVHEALSHNVRAIVTNRQTLCWKTNIHRTSFCPTGVDNCLPYDLVFFDPPYDQCPLLLAGEVLYKALGRLAKPRATSENAVVILRTPEHFVFSGAPGWRIDDHWPISTMNLWILRKSGNQSAGTSEHSDSPSTDDSGPAIDPSEEPAETGEDCPDAPGSQTLDHDEPV